VYSRFTYTDRARVALALGDVDLAEQVLDAVREPIARIGIRDVRSWRRDWRWRG
jgi:hypothetical protein